MNAHGGGGPPDAEPLLIFPYNGNGIEATDSLGDRFRLVGYVDDTPNKQGHHPNGDHVFSRQALRDRPDTRVLAVFGSPHSYLHRIDVIIGLDLPPERFATVVDPSARISRSARLGIDVWIGAGVVVGPNVVIGDHVCILPNSVVHHDSRVEEWSLVGSNVTVAGHTVVERNCYIGSGSSLMNNIHVGERSLVGLGSCVLRDVQPGRRVAGNPHRYLA